MHYDLIKLFWVNLPNFLFFKSSVFVFVFVICFRISGDGNRYFISKYSRIPFSLPFLEKWDVLVVVYSFCNSI